MNNKFKREDIGKEVITENNIKGIIKEVDDIDEHVLVYFHEFDSEVSLSGEQVSWIDLIGDDNV